MTKKICKFVAINGKNITLRLEIMAVTFRPVIEVHMSLKEHLSHHITTWNFQTNRPFSTSMNKDSSVLEQNRAKPQPKHQLKQLQADGNVVQDEKYESNVTLWKRKRGRSTDSTQAEAVMLLRLVMACKAHVAPHGKKSNYF